MLSIGDFARYAGVSVRMLRHYDRIGLLVASYVDPATGYRFYQPALLARANGLVALKGLGFSLDQVGALLDGSIEPATLRGMLDLRRADLHKQIERDRRRLGDIERRLRLMEGENAMELEFVEKALPELNLTQLTGHVTDLDGSGPRVGPLFEELVHKLEESGVQAIHPGVAWYAGEGEGLNLGVGFPGVGAISGTEQGRLDSAPRAVTTVYRGPADGVGQAWQVLGTHIQADGLEFSGPCREIFLTTGEHQEEWVIELQQPVN